MSMKIAEETTEEIKNQILDAAFERFGRFGFGKTTMAEIAKDCQMSAGNLYRYYPNKKEIAADSARRCMQASQELWRDVLKQPGMTPSKRLEALILTKLRYLHQQFSDHPSLFELVIYVSGERGDLVENHLGTQQSLVAEVLAEGNRSGEFDVSDVLGTARVFLAAITKFITPTSHILGAFALGDLEKEAQEVVKLLVQGLAKR
jgi:AcrR family transcriptional regulator